MGKRRGPASVFSGDWSFATAADPPVPPLMRTGTDLVDTKEVEAIVEEPPPKKRKVVPLSQAEGSPGLLGPGWEKYDATGLVQHYTKPKQVPPSLRKCKHEYLNFTSSIVVNSSRPKILRRGQGISHYMMRGVYLMKKAGTV